MKFKLICTIFLFLQFGFGHAQDNVTDNGFKVIPLGVKGGLDEANLSAYLVAAAGSNNYICLDAGTIHAGLQQVALKNLSNAKNVDEFQKKFIKAYFISHGHLDHLAGLIMNAPNDIPKPIYAFPSVIDVLRNNYFTWKSWANFASEGDKPILNKYSYERLEAGKEIEITNTNLKVTPFSLSHVNPYESSAFLVRNNQDYLLYLGDTGADTVENSDKLFTLWKAVTPLVIKGALKSIFIEVSFDNSIPEKALFGHLTPKLLMMELNKLNVLSAGSLKNVQIAVTHIKPCENCTEKIIKEIEESNNLGLRIVYPQQAVPMIIK
jgi:3',5'-cyclic-nucleotide phosphodiesterase